MSDEKVVLATVNPWHKLVASGDEFPTVEPTGTEMNQEQADAAVRAGALVNVALRQINQDVSSPQEDVPDTVTLVAPANTVVADDHSGQIFPAVTADGTTMTPEQAQAAHAQAEAVGVQLTEKE